MSSPSLRRREAAAVATAVVCAGLATWFVAGNGVSLALMAAAVAYAYSLLGLGKISRERAVGLIGGAAAVGLGRILVAAVRPFLDPSTWGTYDFLCFYLDGSVAIRGLNVYDPANYELVFDQLSIPFEPSPSFREGILTVGSSIHRQLCSCSPGSDYCLSVPPNCFGICLCWRVGPW